MAAIWRQKLLLQKPDLDAKAKRRRFWSTFWKEFYNENQQLQNGKKSSLRLPNHHRTLDAASPIRFTTLQLQKTLVVRTQPQQRGTWTQPFHRDLQTPSCKGKKITHNSFGSRRQSGKATILKRFLKWNFNRKIMENHQRQNGKKVAAKSPFSTSMQPLQILQ